MSEARSGETLAAAGPIPDCAALHPGYETTNLYRIFFKQPRHHRRIEIGADANDGVVLEIAHPAIMIIEAEAVLCGRLRMQFDDRDIVVHDQIVDMQLRAMRQHLAELGEGAGNEIGF